jgi:hypothetical protein
MKVFFSGLGRGVEDLVQPFRGDFGELRRELDRRRRRGLEEGVVVGQLEHLPVGGLGQLLAAIADVDAPQPGHAVEHAVAFRVLEPDALGLGNDAAAALLGQRLVIGEGVQVVTDVLGAPLGGRIAGGTIHGCSPGRRRGFTEKLRARGRPRELRRRLRG